jgi:hypothetical protein
VTNWETDPASPAADTDIARIYLPEVDALIRRRLMPGARLELWHRPSSCLRRGPGTANPFYGSGVHQDFGLTADDYQQAMEAFGTVEIARQWRNRYDQDDVAGFMMIDFRRATNMDEPLKHMPLAVCDPGSVSIEDVVPMGLLDFAPTGKPSKLVERARDDPARAESLQQMHERSWCHPEQVRLPNASRDPGFLFLVEAGFRARRRSRAGTPAPLAIEPCAALASLISPLATAAARKNAGS